LKALILNNNEISQIENLNYTIEITTLILAHNDIEEIRGLEKMKKITKLSLSHNKIHVKVCFQ
jgi:Leucine-rich repeat (LRR) protein